eukprot:RCo018770
MRLPSLIPLLATQILLLLWNTHADFVPCPSSASNFPKNGNYIIECYNFTVPLDYSAPSGTQIFIFSLLMRHKALVSRSDVKVQLMFGQGGPGGTGGQAAAGLMSQFDGMDMEIIAPDYRGVGMSSEVTCGGNVSFDTTNVQGVINCINILNAQPSFKYYTVTNAARDLVNLLDTVAVPGAKRFIFGHSFGSYMMERMMQIASPNAYAGAILGGVVHPVYEAMSIQGKMSNFAAFKFIDACDSEPTRFCPSLWGGGSGGQAAGAFTRSVLQSTIKAVKAGTQTCVNTYLPFLAPPKGWKILELALWNLFRFEDQRLGILGILYRLARCNSDDVAALRFFFVDYWKLQDNAMATAAAFGTDSATFHARQNVVWGVLVTLSELFWNPAMGTEPTPAQIQEVIEAMIFQDFSPELFLQAKQLGYPTYPTDQYYGLIPVVNYPVMLVNGGWDPNCPGEWTLALHQGRPSWTLTYFPYGSHNWEFPCEMLAIYGFMQNPATFNPASLACYIAAQVPYDFSATAMSAQTSMTLFNTPYVYGSATPAGLDPNLFADFGALQTCRTANFSCPIVFARYTQNIQCSSSVCTLTECCAPLLSSAAHYLSAVLAVDCSVYTADTLAQKITTLTGIPAAAIVVSSLTCSSLAVTLTVMGSTVALAEAGLAVVV